MASTGAAFGPIRVEVFVESPECPAPCFATNRALSSRWVSRRVLSAVTAVTCVTLFRFLEKNRRWADRIRHAGPDRSTVPGRAPAGALRSATRPNAAILVCVKCVHRFLCFANRYHAVRRGGWSSSVPPTHLPLLPAPPPARYRTSPDRYRKWQTFLGQFTS